MTTNVPNVAVFGGGNTHLEYQLAPTTAPSQKKEARIMTGLGGGGINVATGLARLGVRTELHVLTVPEGNDDPVGAFFRAALGAHQRDLTRHGAHLDIRYVGVLDRQPQAIIRPDLGDIVGDHGEYDPNLLAKVTANFAGELPPIRVLTTPRRITAELGLHFLTIGSPMHRVVVCSGLDLFQDLNTTKQLLGSATLVFLNELEAEALCQLIGSPDLLEVSKRLEVQLVVTNDLVGGLNHLVEPRANGFVHEYLNGVTKPALDPAGTGDAFAATLIEGTILSVNGRTLEQNMARAAQVGGIVAMQRGSLAPANLRELIGEL